MGVTINKKSTTPEPPPYNRQEPKPPGGLNVFYWYQIFALDSAVVEVHKLFNSHGLNIAMYHHGETTDKPMAPRGRATQPSRDIRARNYNASLELRKS